MTLTCPSCGAPTELRNPGITVVVCAACHTTLYREADVLRQGKESVLGEPRSSLHTGAVGKVGDRTIEILGRLRFDHGRGFWDEWYIEDENGGYGWLVEDEKAYTLEARMPEPPALSPDAPVGTILEHGGKRWEVRETGVAQFAGAEGQLDRALEDEGMYRYSDLQEVGGERRLLVEFEDDGSPTGFLGRQVPASLVRFEGAAPPTAAGAEAQTIRCASCGAPFELPPSDEPLETAACPFCDALLELDAAQSIVVGKRREQVPHFALEIGDKGELLDTTWEVIGRIQYVEGRWTSHEYLLHSSGHGYLWLEQDDGHWLYSKRATRGPALGDLAANHFGHEVDVGDTSYKFASHGRSLVDWVDGAFPWKVRLDDAHDYWLLIRPPHTFTVEKSGREIEHFEGSWLPPDLLMGAFGKPATWPVETHLAEPNPVRKWTGVALLAAVFAVINLVLAAGTLTTGVELTSFRVGSTERDVASSIFTVDEGHPTLTVEYNAPVDNSWVYLDVELVDAVEEEPLAAFGDEVGYYHGSDWSEGSRTVTHVFKAVEPGDYRLVVTPEYDRPVDTTITVSAGEQLARYNLMLSVLMLVFAVLVAMRYFNFEQQRFGEGFTASDGLDMLLDLD